MNTYFVKLDLLENCVSFLAFSIHQTKSIYGAMVQCYLLVSRHSNCSKLQLFEKSDGDGANLVFEGGGADYNHILSNYKGIIHACHSHYLLTHGLLQAEIK